MYILGGMALKWSGNVEYHNNFDSNMDETPNFSTIYWGRREWSFWYFLGHFHFDHKLIQCRLNRDGKLRGKSRWAIITVLCFLSLRFFSSGSDGLQDLHSSLQVKNLKAMLHHPKAAVKKFRKSPEYSLKCSSVFVLNWKLWFIFSLFLTPHHYHLSTGG